MHQSQDEALQGPQGSLQEKTQSIWGLSYTFDFIDTQRIMDQGIHTDREIFVIRDRYTGIIWAYPSMEKCTADVINAVNYLKGASEDQDRLRRQSPRI